MTITEFELKALSETDVGKRLSEPGNLVGKVRLNRAGSLVVAFEYRFRWGGESTAIAVGTWPTDKLAAIRRQRDSKRAQISNGENPVTERKTARAAARADQLERQAREKARILAVVAAQTRLTVAQLFEQWHAAQLAPNRKDGGAEIKRMFAKDVLPQIGVLAVEDIRKGHISALLDRIRARGLNRTVGLTLSLVRQMFRFAISRDWIQSDPTATLDPSRDFGVKPVERDRVLSHDEVSELAIQLAQARLNVTTEAAVWIMLATCCRVGEISRARWSDVDLAIKTWTIPAEHAKNGVEHFVHLSDFTVDQFERLREIQTHPEWILPARVPDAEGRWQHISTSSITKQIRDRQRVKPIRGRSTASGVLLLSGGTWTPHDLRRTGATLMGDLGVDPAVIEKCLNHTEPDRLRRIYQRQKYTQEKLRAWDLLGQRLGLLVINSPNVVPIKARNA